ncbi:UDP-4-amino-4,6-dideoxy-N-acetyl-beta-L-altrosamine transaminase [uncultured Arcticibacterium sp.]|uniref:UDP-4-amino-4, 6-dideoxy-N-acetyl-beta-L-altrosamine transaminase n=1 Tax=uncultured Arcticibacterium sp. TaxID=2173042 RepID=UPI0030F54573
MRAISYGRQDISPEDIQVVIEALGDDFLTQGPRILQFEEKFADYVEAKYAVAVSNGTAALHLAAMALNVSASSNVITSPITFVASANCIKYCGGKITFADIDPKTFTLDIEAVRKLLEESPKGTYDGIIPVDFAGYACNLEEFKALAEEYGLWIIEDACHAPGGYFIDSKKKKQKCGNGAFADLAIFSFHPVKHIAAGEGGMITTNDKALYERLLSLRTHGITKEPSKLIENHGLWYHEMHELGYNYRLTDFQAALATSQLRRADEGLKRRHEIAQRYESAFKGTAVKTAEVASDVYHAYHLYLVELNNRKKVYDELRKHKIFTQVHYIPVHTQPFYRNLESKRLVFPVAETYYAKTLSLPMFPSLTDEEQDFVITKILEVAE